MWRALGIVVWRRESSATPAAALGATMFWAIAAKNPSQLEAIPRVLAHNAHFMAIPPCLVTMESKVSSEPASRAAAG